MINDFVRVLSGRTALDLRLDYEEQVRQLNYLLTTYPQRYQWLGDRRFVEYLIALGTFYQRIIVNLEGASTLSQTIFGTSAATQVRLGTRTIQQRDVTAINTLARNFWQILARYGINPNLLTYDNVAQLLGQVHRWIETSKPGRA